MLDQRARLLRAAVGFSLVPPTEPERDPVCASLLSPDAN
jgi:hypothetical protein